MRDHVELTWARRDADGALVLSTIYLPYAHTEVVGPAGGPPPKGVEDRRGLTVVRDGRTGFQYQVVDDKEGVRAAVRKCSLKVRCRRLIERATLGTLWSGLRPMTSRTEAYLVCQDYCQARATQHGRDFSAAGDRQWAAWQGMADIFAKLLRRTQGP